MPYGPLLVNVATKRDPLRTLQWSARCARQSLAAWRQGMTAAGVSLLALAWALLQLPYKRRSLMPKKLHKAFFRFAATAVAMVLLKPLHAAENYVDLATIRDAAEQAIRAAAGTGREQLLVAVSMPDARLRLASCPESLRASVAGDGQLRERTTVGVRCEAGARWAIYLSAALATELPVLVAQRALALGAVPQAADFSSVTRRLPGLSNNYVTDVAQLVGQHLRRPVAQGEALSADALVTAAIVHRGQQLTLLAHSSGMDVRVMVIALADGKPDELIRVQNPASQRIIEATVRSAQLVDVSL